MLFTEKYDENQISNTLENEVISLGGQASNLYYINGIENVKEDTYLYEPTIKVVFKIKGIDIYNTTIHSIKYGEIVKPKNDNDKNDENHEEYTEVAKMTAEYKYGYYEPDLNGFDPKNTYIIYYSNDYTQTKEVVLEKYLADGRNKTIEDNGTTYTFYDYIDTTSSANTSTWGNVKTKANGQEAWWVWIPRYSYNEASISSSSGFEIKFITTDNKVIQIDEEENTTLIDLSEYENYIPHSGFTEKYTNLEGNIVNVKELKGIWMSKFKPSQTLEIQINEKTYCYAPNVEGYDINRTYVITYDKDGTEVKNEYLLKDVLQEGYKVSSAGALRSGKVDESKIPSDEIWYDYGNKIWGNLKTTANGLEAWWVWLPRYAYSLEGSTTGFSIMFIDTNDKPFDSSKDLKGHTPHPGFNIKEADGSTTKLKGLWMSKYKPSQTTSQKNSNITKCYAPNVEGYDINKTYVVTYDKDGTTVKNEYLLKNVLKEGYNATGGGTLISGEVDINKIPSDEVWYDYGNRIWGNLKTTANGLEAWWVWIPRYAYSLEGSTTGFSVIFIDTNNNPFDTTKDLKGHTPHLGFDLKESDGSTTKLKGLWMSKYKPSDVSDIEKDSSGNAIVVTPDVVQSGAEDSENPFPYAGDPTGTKHTHVANGAGTKKVHVSNSTNWCDAYNGTTPCSHDGHHRYCSLCGVKLRYYWCNAHINWSTKVIINDE